jgi:hypothetical protein
LTIFNGIVVFTPIHGEFIAREHIIKFIDRAIPFTSGLVIDIFNRKNVGLDAGRNKIETQIQPLTVDPDSAAHR